MRDCRITVKWKRVCRTRAKALTGGGGILLPCAHAPRRWAEEDQEGAQDLPFCFFLILVFLNSAYRIRNELNAKGEGRLLV